MPLLRFVFRSLLCKASPIRFFNARISNNNLMTVGLCVEDGWFKVGVVGRILLSPLDFADCVFEMEGLKLTDPMPIGVSALAWST